MPHRKDKDSGASEVGYGKPPKEHAFKKGQSGNPKGRPRKNERALTPRQFRRDFLSVMEELVPIRTSEGTRKVPASVAVLVVIRNKALAGHAPSQRFIANTYQALLHDHHEAHADHFQQLEDMEKAGVVGGLDEDPGFVDLVNSRRKLTRRV